MEGSVSRSSPSRSRSSSREHSNAQPHLVAIQCHLDDRGFLCQILGNYNEFLPKVARAYVVGNFAQGTIRGLHMHKLETKAYFVVNGSAKFVVVDREKKNQAYTLSERNPAVLVVPPSYYHGWISLEANTTLIGLSDRMLEQSLKDDYRADPMAFGNEVWRVVPR